MENKLFEIDYITKAQAKEINPLVFAFVGDSVHTMYARTSIASVSTAKANVLHTKASKLVMAKAQAEKMELCLPLLTEEENDIFMRARNSHVNTIAKNASLKDYKMATCYEAVLGYLYMTGQIERLNFLINK